MSCPWAKIAQPEPISLSDIMSEEIARDLQAKEDQKFISKDQKGAKQEEESKSDIAQAVVPEQIPAEVLKALSDETFESDEMIALTLQKQYDKEYDDMLKMTEQKYNGSSKVSVSFENYRRAPQCIDFESESEEEEVEDIIERKDWDRFDALGRVVSSIPPCGYKIINGNMVTKHDLVNNGRNNARKLLSFPPEFQTGDGEDIDLKLSNKVFNSLKKHSDKEQVRRHKVHDRKEDHATAEFGMDEFTRILLYKMINNQLLERVNGVISIGKEAVVLHADSNPNFPEAKQPLPPECVIKVFKTTLSEFKQRDKYIKDDYRFKDRIGKQTSRKTVNLWAEKEMANLMRLERAGLNCPRVVTLKKHVLVMSFIGQDHVPAPKLKDAKLRKVDYIMAYDEIVEGMKTLYEKANLIHADLSEYNVLWHNKKCYFIDVSQSVEPSHENAFHFLYRDCCNVVNFFSKKNVRAVKTPDEIFEYVTGCAFNDQIALISLQESFKMKPHLVDKPGIELACNFETAWEKSKCGDIPSIAANIEQAQLVEPPQA